MFTNFLFHPKVIALIKECKHCLCEGCLKALMESSKGSNDSIKSIDCPDPDCQSFVTVKTVEEFQNDRRNPHKPV